MWARGGRVDAGGGLRHIDGTMIDLTREGTVFVLRMNDGENRFNGASIAAWNRALDEVERAATPSALVTTGAGKFYSNGLDLTWIGGPECADKPAFVRDVQRFLGRVLTFPRPTVAALNGHAFAAGAMLSLAHDFAVMREDRGFFCLPEVDIDIPFTEGMTALIAAKIPQPALHEACTTGKRYGGPDAARAGIVTKVASEDAVVKEAVAIATALAGKTASTLAAIKKGLYTGAVAALEKGALGAGFS